MKSAWKLTRLLAAASLLAGLIASAPMIASALPQASLEASTQFYVPKPLHGAVEQIADLTASGNTADA